jgi:hypothetical protein
VAFDAEGRPDLPQLLRRHGLAHAWRIRQARLWCPVRYVLFDLLYHAGRSLLHEPLVRRREVLAFRVPPFLRLGSHRSINNRAKRFLSRGKSTAYFLRSSTRTARSSSSRGITNPRLSPTVSRQRLKNSSLS